MEAGRLLQVITDFVHESGSLQLPQVLNTVVSSLQQSMQGQPAQQATHEQNFRDGLSKLFVALEESPSNFWPPSKLQILEKSGLAASIGRGLRARITKILNHDITSRQLILNDLQKILQDVQKQITEATQVATALPNFGVAPALPPKGKAEIGFLLPNAIDTERITGINRELKVIDRALKTVAELHGEEVSSAAVSDVDRGSLSLFAVTSYVVARGILDLTDKVLNIWQRIIDLKRQHAELKEGNVPPEILDALTAHIDERLSTESAAIAAKMVSEVNFPNKERLRELETQLRIVIKDLATRIDHGAKIEASVLSERDQAPQASDDELALIRKVAEHGSLMADTPQIEKPILALNLDLDASDQSHPAENPHPANPTET